MATTRALLLTDVVDSTRLSEGLGDARMAEVWAAHDTVARELLPAHAGLEIDKTDGFLMLFEDAAAALAYAEAYHAALAELSTALGVPLAARAGLHLGDVLLRRNPAEQVARGAKPLEVEGLAKPTAARIMSVARGGQTLLSAEAAAAVGGALVSHGHWRMKGRAEPIELFERDAPGAPLQPPEDGAKVYRVVSDGELWLPAREVPHNLTRERDAFVGRAADLRLLAQRLDEGAALVTVTGPGGTGKTRLVRRFGWSWLGDFPGGVWFVDLAEAKDLVDLVATTAAVLGVPVDDEAPVAALGEVLATRGRCLVIVDNCEQLVEAAAEAVETWLDATRDAVFLVTSREVLAVPGEQVVPVAPLDPVTEGVALFEARARAQQPAFSVTSANRRDVEAIVRQLDGLPLAIELAAARIRAMPPATLLQRLEDRFRLLTAARRGAGRQATLRATIDWSWALLEPWERSALAQCSAFEGGFELDSAEAVVDLSAWPGAPWTMDVIGALVDKSLLRSWEPATSGERFEAATPLYGMFVSIRAYAAEQLAAEGTPAVHATWRRHADHFTALCAGLVRTDRARLRSEAGNLRAALDHATTLGDAATAVRGLPAAQVLALAFGLSDPVLPLVDGLLALDLDDHQRLTAGSVWVAVARDRVPVERLLEHLVAQRALAAKLGHPAAEVDAMIERAGVLIVNAHRREDALPLLDEAEALARAHDLPRALAMALDLRHLDAVHEVGHAPPELQAALRAAFVAAGLPPHHLLHHQAIGLAHQGRFDEAAATWEELGEVGRNEGEVALEGLAAIGLAVLGMVTDAPDALGRIAHAVDLAHRAGNHRFLAVGHAAEAVVRARAGDLAGAEAALAEGDRLARSMRHLWELAMVQAAAAVLRHASGDVEGARARLAEAEALEARTAPEFLFLPLARAVLGEA